MYVIIGCQYFITASQVWAVILLFILYKLYFLKVFNYKIKQIEAYCYLGLRSKQNDRLG